MTSLLLAAIGIYGVLAYSVTERTREIGVRVALGAQPGRIVGLIVGAGARVVMAGTVVGVAGALGLSGLLKSLLFGVGPRDTATLDGAAGADRGCDGRGLRARAPRIAAGSHGGAADGIGAETGGYQVYVTEIVLSSDSSALRNFVAC